MSLTPVKFGIAFTLKHLNQAGALVHVYTDGSVLVNHGGTEMGQGLHTKVAQVVAQEFGIGFDEVRITATKTDMVPNTTPTAASSGSDLNGMAAKRAAATIKDRMAALAGRLYQVPKAEVRFAGGMVAIGKRESPLPSWRRPAFSNGSRSRRPVTSRHRRSPGTARRRAGGRSSISPTAPPARR